MRISPSRLSSLSFLPPKHHHHHHHHHHQTRNMSTSTTPSIKPQFSSTYPPDQGTAELKPLLKENGGRWALMQSGRGVERGFRFKGFKGTWDFMNLVAAECKKQKHHPEWSNVYNTAFVRWTTHSPAGLSEKDVLMARFCDEQARTCGELVVEDGEEGDVVGKGLVERVVVEGGDCCVPKKKEAL